MPVRVFLVTDTVFLLSLFPKDRKWAKNKENFLFLGFDSLVLETVMLLIKLL